MPDLFRTITPDDWRTGLAAARVRRAGQPERIKLAITAYQLNNMTEPKQTPTTDASNPEKPFRAELSGKLIRKLGRERLFQTGDRLSNQFGQELWTMKAFHQKGVRIEQWPHGKVSDYTWEQVYRFYEIAPDTEEATP